MSFGNSWLSGCVRGVVSFVATLLAVCSFYFVAPSTEAQAGLEVEVGAGWEGMILQENYSTLNSGTMFNLGLGYVLFDFVGVFVDQDLGYIELDPKIGKDKKLFNGATILNARARIFSLAILESWIKAGAGLQYMKNYSGDMDKWFAARFGLMLAVKLSSIRVGADVNYTLGIEDKNNFDGKDKMHFVSARVFLGYEF